MKGVFLEEAAFAGVPRARPGAKPRTGRRHAPYRQTGNPRRPTKTPDRQKPPTDRNLASRQKPPAGSKPADRRKFPTDRKPAGRRQTHQPTADGGNHRTAKHDMNTDHRRLSGTGSPASDRFLILSRHVQPPHLSAMLSHHAHPPSGMRETNSRDSPVIGSVNRRVRATSSSGWEKSSYGRVWMRG